MGFTLIFMALATITELYLIEHFEDSWQLVPIIIIALIIIATGWLIRHPSPLSFNIFRLLLLASVLSGFAGIYFHLKANIEFETEMHPDQAFSTTLVESLSGALPALAPGSMIVFALFGYIYLLLNNKLRTHETK